MSTSSGTVARVRLALEGTTAVQQGLAKVEDSVSSAAKSLVGLAGGLSVAGFATWIKGAINAADESSKLAQKAGLAVNQVAGLQLAFGQSGISAEQFVPIMAKLGVAVTNGNKALTAMGVASQNADGSLKSTRQVLGEVSDKFAAYQDGAAKTALAVGLFGEEGAKLLPLLNQGASGLAQYDLMAQQLGLTLDSSTAKAAEQFNDTLDLMSNATAGVATQVAARLLPTLNTLAGEMFRSLVQGDALNTVVNVLSGTMKGLYSVAVGVVTAFKTVGMALGGVGAAVAALISGDFGSVRTIIRDMAADISASWSSAGASIIKVWEGAGDSTVSALAQANAAMNGAVPVLSQNTKATNAKAEADKAASDALKLLLAAAQSNNAAFDEEFKRIEDARLASEGRIRTTREMLESIERETALIGMSNDERERSSMLWELERQGIVAGTEAYDAFISRLDDALLRRRTAQAAADLRKDQVSEWQRTWDQVSQSFTDALMEGGKSVSDYLKDLFRTLVLRPILAPIAAAGAGLLSPSTAGASVSGGFSAGGVGDLLGSIGQLGGLAGAFGTGMAASFSSMMSAGISGWASAAGSLIGSGAVSGIAAGLGMIAAPLAAAAVLWKPLFGRELAGSGIIGDFGPNGFTGQSWDYYKGGLLRSDKTTYGALDDGLRRSLSQRFAGITSGNAAAARALGIDPTSILQSRYTGLSYDFQGKSQQDIDEWFNQMFQGLSDSQAMKALGNKDLVRDGESATAALTRLSTSLQAVNRVFDTLGATAYQVSLAGGDMASSLADLFGGLEAFSQASTAYYEAFYTEAERTATTTRQLTAALGQLGLQLPGTRDAYRALVDAQDLTTEAGRSTYAALLQLAPAFASISTSADDLGRALEQAGNSIADEIRRLRGLTTTASADQGLAALQARFATATAAARAGSSSALEELPAISQALEEAAALQAKTAAELALLRGQTAASLQATLGTLGLTVPAFEVGTNYVPRTMLAQVHEGEAIVPRAYNPAAGGTSPGSDAMAAELRALRRAVDQLRTEVNAGLVAVATHTAKTSRVLDRVARDGNAFVTVAEA